MPQISRSEARIYLAQFKNIVENMMSQYNEQVIQVIPENDPRIIENQNLEQTLNNHLNFYSILYEIINTGNSEYLEYTQNTAIPSMIAIVESNTAPSLISIISHTINCIIAWIAPSNPAAIIPEEQIYHAHTSQNLTNNGIPIPGDIEAPGKLDFYQDKAI